MQKTRINDVVSCGIYHVAATQKSMARITKPHRHNKPDSGHQDTDVKNMQRLQFDLLSCLRLNTDIKSRIRCECYMIFTLFVIMHVLIMCRQTVSSSSVVVALIVYIHVYFNPANTIHTSFLCLIIYYTYKSVSLSVLRRKLEGDLFEFLG